MRSRCLATATAAALLVTLTACGSSRPAATPTTSSGRIAVVASTDVWGDVVQAVGGDAVTVHSVIDRSSQDPHEYESTVRDQLAVRRAALVVENGGGYDDFMGRLLAGAAPHVARLDAADLSGYDQHPSQGDFNEHLWYDVPTVRKVAVAVADRLASLRPVDRAAIRARLARFERQLDGLRSTEGSIRRAAEGTGIAITEPVPLYLTAACGLINRTEPAFSKAVEDGDDMAPAVLNRQLVLLRSHRVAMLAVNVQTEGTTTDQTVSAARAAGVPVVVFRETLPTGEGYVAWMRSELAAVAGAIR